MTTGHVLAADALAARTKGTWKSIAWFFPLILLMHIPLDLVWHLEPGLWNTDYTKAWSWGWDWTVLDISASVGLAYLATRRYPKQRSVIWAGVLAALLPDLLMVYASRHLYQAVFAAYYHFHNQLHWWKVTPITNTCRAVAALVTVTFDIYCYKLLPKPHEAAAVEVILTAEAT